MHAAERFCRIRGFLGEVERRASSAERRLVDYYLGVLSEYEDKLFRQAGPSLRSTNLDVGDLAPVFEAFQQFVRIHGLCVNFVSRPNVAPELYTLIEECFTIEGVTTIEPTVVYYPKYTFAEADVAQSFKGTSEPTPGRVAVFLPFADFRAPLMWPALAHEMGHALFKVRRIVEKLGTPQLEAPAKRFEAWAEEYWSDIVGIRLFGPAYLCAFIAVILTDHPTRYVSSDRHPPPAHRIAYMRKLLDESGVLPGDAGEYYATLFDQLSELWGGPPSEERLLIPTKRLWSLLEKECDAVMLPAICDSGMAQMVEVLRTKSRNGVRLLSGLSLENPATDLMRRLRRRIDRGATVEREDVYSLLQKSEERPAPIAAILAVGWERQRDEVESVVEAVASIGRSDEFFRNFRAILDEKDKDLMKSIESAKIHTVLRQ